MREAPRLHRDAARYPGILSATMLSGDWARMILRMCRADCAEMHDAARVRARHMGAATPSRNPLPGSRASRWKKRVDGSVVPRD